MKIWNNPHNKLAGKKKARVTTVCMVCFHLCPKLTGVCAGKIARRIHRKSLAGVARLEGWTKREAYFPTGLLILFDFILPCSCTSFSIREKH